MGSIRIGGKRRILWEVRDKIGFLIEVQKTEANAHPSKDKRGAVPQKSEVTVKKLQVAESNLQHPEKGAVIWEQNLFLEGTNDLELLREAVEAVKLKKETSDLVFERLSDL